MGRKDDDHGKQLHLRLQVEFKEGGTERSVEVKFDNYICIGPIRVRPYVEGSDKGSE